MKTNFLALSALFLSCIANSSAQNLPGFEYKDMDAPTGTEWESPEQYALNKEQPKAYFFNFSDVTTARKVLPENSKYHISLDGTWKFNWVANPDKRPMDFFKTSYNDSQWDDISVPSNWNVVGLNKENGEQKYGTPIYVNQPVIFKHTVAVDDWRGGVMREPNPNHTTYNARNEVGSYRRTFTVPTNWKNRQTYINFDGVDSFFYLYVNGEYVGFSKNSRNKASFNITEYLVSGENVVAVEVYRNSDGSFLEAQDMFRLPGIYRSVSLTSSAETEIRDLRIIPDLDENYVNAKANIELDIRNFGKKDLSGYSIEYSLYANKLYSDENSKVEGVKITTQTPKVGANATATTTATLEVENPNKWSAEEPYRYTLVAELKDKKGKTLEIASAYFGFREVEIKDTKAQDDEFGLAGRYYYINGEPVKLKGVNRHEHSPELGHAITHEQMLAEVMLMKQGNINHVRLSHYPCSPYFYYLADKYGLYFEDEANIESHEYYYGEASLSHVAEFESAHISRVMEMAHATVNSPAVVIWSLGNEAGPGDTFIKAYDALHAFDTSRPVQYERNNSIVDMGSNQYPSIAWTKEAVKGEYNLKYPFHISEYAHSMGNAGGNLADYWEAIESTNFFCGGAIWDWIDQSLYNYTKDGVRYAAYGGDFGDRPNDATFCMNGVIFSDLTPKDEYYEVKKVYQNVEVKVHDLARKEIEIFNKRYFTTLNDLELRVSLWRDGKMVEGEVVSLPTIAPRERRVLAINDGGLQLESGREYFVKFEFLLKNDMPWAKRGYVQMEEQILLQEASCRPSISQLSSSSQELTLESSSQEMTVVTNSTESFKVVFNNQTGAIDELVYGENVIMPKGSLMRLSGFRAPVDNDNWASTNWFRNGLYNLEDEVLSQSVVENGDGSVSIQYVVFSQSPAGGKWTKTEFNTWKIEEGESEFTKDDFHFVSTRIWTIYKDGSVELNSTINGSNPNLSLARLGYEILLPSEYENYTYYGRGPHNNYNDRRSGAFIEQYQSTVKDQFQPFPRPQDMSNREEVRWCALTNASGSGVMFVANGEMSTSALEWSDVELAEAGHPYELPQSSGTTLHLDCKVNGLGGNSCGQGGPLSYDRVMAGDNSFGFIIRAVEGGNFEQVSNVSGSGVTPISVQRSRSGLVSMNCAKEGARILYTAGRTRDIKEYSGEPFDLREGGLVTVWEASSPALMASFEFEEIDNLPLEVVYASSEEGGSAKNMVDGDPTTMWHTMWSVTVAQYPHWVDFDAGEECEIVGFSYLPRQDGGTNGVIKEYEIYVSGDGKDWGDAVASGSFERGSREKKIELPSVVTGRYIRFRALSSENGADYASGAEFGVLRKK